MDFHLHEIKLLRKKLGITQFELAKRAGVSQSLIAKIEADRIDPTFTKTQKIFEALQALSQKQSKKAKDIMNPQVFSVRSDDILMTVVEKMRTYNISQLPVVDHHVIGVVSESSILDKLRDGKDVHALRVKEIMEDCPPLVSEETDVTVLSLLLRHTPMVLISRHGKLSGLVTKADILKSL